MDERARPLSPERKANKGGRKIHFCLCILSLKELLTALTPGELLHLSLNHTFVSSWPDSTGPDDVLNHFTAASQKEKEGDVMGDFSVV